MREETAADAGKKNPWEIKEIACGTMHSAILTERGDVYPSGRIPIYGSTMTNKQAEENCSRREAASLMCQNLHCSDSVIPLILYCVGICGPANGALLKVLRPANGVFRERLSRQGRVPRGRWQTPWVIHGPLRGWQWR